MNLQTVDVPADALLLAVRDRLYGTARLRKGPVRWAEGNREILVYPEETQLRLGAGWLIVTVVAAADQFPRAIGRLVFALGRAGEADGLRAAATLDLPDPDGLLAMWGAALQGAVWAGVMDAVESSTRTATRDDLRWGAVGLWADDKAIRVRLAERVGR